MALSGSTATATYRLRGGTFHITGPAEVTASTEDDPAASTLAVALVPGAYLVQLQPGWVLERQATAGESPAPIVAELTSPNPLQIVVRGQETTNALFQFRAGDVLIELGPGQVRVGIAVDDSRPANAGTAGAAGAAVPMSGTDGAGGSTGGPVAAVCSGGAVVISQIYGGSGDAEGVYTSDFIELHNRATEPVNLAGWSVQYASASGSTWAVTALPPTVLPAGGFFLVRQTTGGITGLALPAADGQGSINLAATAGKVALVSSRVALAGGCPIAASIVDLVGYGTASCYEGSGPAPTPSATNAVIRVGGGCVDSGQNSADTALGFPSPRNLSTPAETCTCSSGP